MFLNPPTAVVLGEALSNSKTTCMCTKKLQGHDKPFGRAGWHNPSVRKALHAPRRRCGISFGFAKWLKVMFGVVFGLIILRVVLMFFCVISYLWCCFV